MEYSRLHGIETVAGVCQFAWSYKEPHESCLSLFGGSAGPVHQRDRSLVIEDYCVKGFALFMR